MYQLSFNVSGPHFMYLCESVIKCQCCIQYEVKDVYKSILSLVTLHITSAECACIFERICA